ncbi:DUF3283 family protein [Vibrio sp. AK197]|uniref:DUF3283 family protein n=1 Tax=Vibrio olivae TaxID=1243002 RepID=A0ABV5HMQ3_9VIBR
MSMNLSLLPADEKNRIELDKQASFIVWKIKQSKAGPDSIDAQLKQLSKTHERECFEQSVEKYKRIMGV